TPRHLHDAAGQGPDERAEDERATNPELTVGTGRAGVPERRPDPSPPDDQPVQPQRRLARREDGTVLHETDVAHEPEAPPAGVDHRPINEIARPHASPPTWRGLPAREPGM